LYVRTAFQEIVTTRRLGAPEEVEKRLPPALVELTELPGLGPKRVKLLHDKRQTRTLEDLERAASAGRVREIRGLGPKTGEKTLQAIVARLRDPDVVVCAVHYKFDVSRDRQTERIIRAMDNPYFNILAHPSGRLLGEREALNAQGWSDLTRLLKRP
jgi:hypothetical protein